MFSLKRLINAVKYSVAGLWVAIKEEPAFQLEVFALVLAIPLALIYGDGAIEKSLLIGSVGLVLVVELLNSAIENVVDLASPEQHDLARKAKDIGSAAVFVMIVISALIWLVFMFS